MSGALKRLTEAKIGDAPGILRQYLSMQYLRGQFERTMDAYRAKYIETNSIMPLWHVIYGGTLFSYIFVWPTEYAHYKHKEEARLRGESH